MFTIPLPFRLLCLALLLVGGVASASAQDGEVREEVLQDEPAASPEVELGLEQPEGEDAAELQAEAEAGEDAHGALPPVWLVIPFAVLLLMIATGPLFYLDHWHHHYPKYAVALGALVVASASSWPDRRR